MRRIKMNGILKSMFLCLLLFNVIGCFSQSNCDCCKTELQFPNKIVHQVDENPVKITNIFPEHGLTDPHVMQVGDRLYLGMGHDQSWDIEYDWTMDRWEIWSTNDLKTWVKETVIHPNDTYFGPEANCWAGDFAQKDGKYYWYFSNRNFDTGVMVANQPGGPYEDALGKPLLPRGLAPTNSYDPEVFEEDGVYTIMWGGGTYYTATLGDDMLSLADEPQKVTVYNPDGSTHYTDDKPTLFKRDRHYYLVWGNQYAMSDNVHGPYAYKGDFYSGAHGSIFNWEDQWYVVHEFHDISMFYRGIMLKPMSFYADGTVDLKSDFVVPESGGRVWEFDHTRMGWRSPADTDKVQWTNEGRLRGEISSKKPIIESANWATTDIKGRVLTLKLKNETSATKLKVSFASLKTDVPRFWSFPNINWLEEASHTISLEPQNTEFKTYTLNLDAVSNLPSSLKRLRLEFLNTSSGTWEIDYIRIE
ncbi:family 43 glycosylhydrolase [Tamlana sp. 2_MG-2023]|uniref:family 43 glycosylhydrolase n=1 Tax=unclassified Tamlana TaxID=2614803 RepID=UPI0026E31C31|nr:MULTISPECIES: family 43 glycosylhydrolase [unclassified Tamlana]MDO6761265.1 family 43 glycosylhydrolase [Tamlana sp. 2_MG-2023]MDO6791748.1 family 43 glycosylhydrolase [Tamlana sp. 1_MG-2023]